LSERDGTCLVKARSKIGQAQTEAKLPFDEKSLKKKLDRFAIVAQGATPVGGELREFGQELHRTLFRDAVWNLLKKTTVASEDADGLLIELDIQSPKLSHIPWELLHDGTDFVALSRRTPVVRSVSNPESQTAGEVNPVELPIRILLAAVKPWGPAPLNMGRQIRDVCRALEKAMRSGQVDLHPALEEEVQPDNFRAAMRTGGYHILHISTHGAFSEELDKGFILLEDGTGHPVRVAVSAIAGIMRDTTVQLVYLDACETGVSSADTVSGSLAEVLVRSGAGATIAMQFSIRDDLARAFSEAFYHYLMESESLWYAVTEARISLLDLQGRETIHWAIPALYVREGYEFSTQGIRLAQRRYGRTYPPSPFVGRDQQLDQLAEKLLRPSTRAVIIHGFGGIGKSKLVQKMLSEIELLFEDSCLVDCRGAKEVTEIVPQINEMLSMHAAPILSRELTNLSETGRLEYICSQLDRGRFLLVLDNIDDMQETSSINQFLDLVEKLKMAKVVVSCRMPTRPPAYQQQLKVTALDSKYAVDMIRDVGRNIPQIADATESDLLRINDRLRGHPLSIMIAIPYFDGEPFESALRDLPTRLGSDAEIAEGILDWSYANLSPEEQRFLENASVFYSQVPMEAMLDINDGKGRDILVRLVRKNMIEFSPTTKLYALHPRLHEYAYGKLGDRRDNIQIKAAREIAPRLVGRYWNEAMQLYSYGVESARNAGNRELAGKLLGSLGSMHHRMGNYDKAKKCQEESLAIARKLEDRSLEAAALHNLGSVEYSRGNYLEARKLYNESLAIARKLGIQKVAAATLHQLAMIEHHKGNDPEAERLYYESKRIFETLGDQSGIAATLHELAMIEQRKGNYPEAERLYNEARGAFEKLGDQSGIAATLHELAVIEHRKGNYPEALRLYNEAKRMFGNLGDQTGVAATLGQLGTIEEDRGNYPEAVRFYNESLAIERKLGNKSGIAKAMYHLGRVESSRGNYPEAVRLYNESLTIERNLENQSGIAATLHELAVIEHRKGNYPEAVRLYNESLEIQRKLEDQSGIAVTLHGLGEVEEQKGNYPEAVRFYNESLEIQRKLKNQSGIASILHDLAMIEHRKGNYPEAVRLYNESLEIKRNLGDQSGIAKTLHQLGMIEQDKGNYPEAVRFYNESLEISQELGDQSVTAGTLHQLAMIEQRKGNYPEAVRLYNESLAIERKLGEQSGIAATLHGLAVVEQQEGNYPEAVRLYNESLEISQELGDQPGSAATLHQLGLLAEIYRGDLNVARQLYEQALQIFENLGLKRETKITRESLERVRKLEQKT
jgi:tetratricopeptide (TPR) repeat protein